jgi:uncharacterized protein (DUF983 family)
MNKPIHKMNLVLSILSEKCPKCKQGKVFKNSTFFQLPEMNSFCSHCNYKYDREPGYFIGAMYLSYGLAVLQGLLTFMICYFAFPQMETLTRVLSVIVVIILFGKKNYKLSRIIYIHIFPW